MSSALRSHLRRIGAVTLALTTGIACAATVATALDDPGHVLRTATGWRWDRLAETFVSWWLPSVAGSFGVAVVLEAAAAGFRRLRRGGGARGDAD